VPGDDLGESGSGGAAAAWRRPSGGFEWRDGDLIAATGEPAGSVLAPRHGPWDAIVVVPRRGSTLVDQFAGLAPLQGRALWDGVRRFADTHGWLGIPVEVRAVDGETTLWAERLVDWTLHIHTVAVLHRLMEQSLRVEHSGSAADRHDIEACFRWTDEGLVAFMRRPWELTLRGPDIERVRRAVRLSDAQLARLARTIAAARLTHVLRGRLRVNVVGCDPRHVLSRSKPVMGVTYVADALIGALYHELALDLVGSPGLRVRCLHCHKLIPARRRTRRYCDATCRRAYHDRRKRGAQS
jgi:hypothetical protein